MDILSPDVLNLVMRVRGSQGWELMKDDLGIL
jgi:hypothetical protein